jgi:hypothetical protein
MLFVFPSCFGTAIRVADQRYAHAFGVLLALAVKLLGSYWFRYLVIGCLLVVVFWSFRVVDESFLMLSCGRGS